MNLYCYLNQNDGFEMVFMVLGCVAQIVSLLDDDEVNIPRIPANNTQ